MALFVPPTFCHTLSPFFAQYSYQLHSLKTDKLWSDLGKTLFIFFFFLTIFVVFVNLFISKEHKKLFIYFFFELFWLFMQTMSCQKSTKNSVIIIFSFIHTHLLIDTHVLKSFSWHSKSTFAQASRVLNPPSPFSHLLVFELLPPCPPKVRSFWLELTLSPWISILLTFREKTLIMSTSIYGWTQHVF